MVDSRETCGTEEQRAVRGKTETQILMPRYSFKISAMILLLSAVCFFSFTAEAKYGGGTGEPNEPYLIYDANQMNAIGADSNDWDKCFKLMSNVDLSEYTGTEFNIIGEYVSSGNPKNKPFTGLFDGNGHTISNFTYASTGTICKGLFRYVMGVIKDLGLIDPDIGAGTGGYVGSLVGYNSGTITGCYVEGGSISGNGRVGGLVGYNYRAIITNCYSTGSVSGTTDIGGLVGYNTRAIITNCYSTGSVSGTTDIGGLVGRNYGDVIGSFWDTQTSGQATSAGGTGLTTAEMQMASTFFDWACDAFWTIDEGVDYPRLWWQNMPGEPITTPFYGAGNGTEADPHLIYTAEQLNTFGLFPCLRDKHFKLMADIDLSGYTGTEFNIIGDVYDPFTGVFDGNGHTISNFKYDCNGVNNIGLFGYVKGSDVEIKDLGLLDPNIDAGSGSSVGSLVGWFYSGNLSNCYVRGGRVAGNQSVGGLVGLNYGTITSCSSSGIVEGSQRVGGLIGNNLNGGAITDCYSEGSVEGNEYIGGLLGRNLQGAITDCYSSASVSGSGNLIGGLLGSTIFAVIIENCYATGNVTGEDAVGGLVGYNYRGKISDCSATGTVEGTKWVGGLVGYNTDRSTITNCCWVGDRVAGATSVGGLAGYNGWSYLTEITNCFAEAGSVTGKSIVGGLVGWSNSKITYCYSMASVSGGANVGGLVGYIYNSKIDNCYSAGEVYGDRPVGGLVGLNAYSKIYGCFWDIETSGQTYSDGGTGKNTDEMQTMSTFSWDFTTPLWTIDEGVDYPRLWWEFVPVLGAEPEVTLGTSNIISWDPIPGVNDFYAECAEDANFTSIVYNSGWISETSFEFTGLEVGRQYWYSVKARNGLGEECQWSNVETSLQGTLADAVEMKLGPESLKNNNLKNTLLNKIDEVLDMIDEGLYEDALNKLQNDILAKTDGCGRMGQPDKNDWIITCEEQAVIYPLVMDTIEHVRGLMEQEAD